MEMTSKVKGPGSRGGLVAWARAREGRMRTPVRGELARVLDLEGEWKAPGSGLRKVQRREGCRGEAGERGGAAEGGGEEVGDGGEEGFGGGVEEGLGE